MEASYVQSTQGMWGHGHGKFKILDGLGLLLVASETLLINYYMHQLTHYILAHFLGIRANSNSEQTVDRHSNSM